MAKWSFWEIWNQLRGHAVSKYNYVKSDFDISKSIHGGFLNFLPGKDSRLHCSFFFRVAWFCTHRPCLYWQVFTIFSSLSSSKLFLIKSKVCKSCCWLNNYYGSLYCFRKRVFRELLLLLWLKKLNGLLHGKFFWSLRNRFIRLLFYKFIWLFVARHHAGVFFNTNFWHL